MGMYLFLDGGILLTGISSCQAILQGHTSLVGQLQMRGNTLVTGGSDGSVRVWSLEKMAPIHRLAAHDNSVTSLQFDDTRVVSGGSDGRVKVWDLKTGQLVRELTAPADAVWRVAFEEEKCVVMASRSNRTIMEVSSPTALIHKSPINRTRYGLSPHPKMSSTKRKLQRTHNACSTPHLAPSPQSNTAAPAPKTNL
jgi:WD40 repeat protein